VLVDTSAYLALFDRDDQHHVEATAILPQLIRAGYRQYTTNVLVIEAHALFLSRVGIAAGQEFLMQMQQSSTVVVRVRAADEERAKEIIFRYADKDFSLADAISFVVMERLQIRQAFTFDQHFAQYGFAVLAPGRV
jgi:predicted nucleic acid-binding protein